MFEYDSANSFSVNDQFSAVKSLPGPVLLVKPVQRQSQQPLKDKVIHRYPFQVIDPASADDLAGAMQGILRQYQRGGPSVPRKYVAGLLVVNKLVQGNMWGGKNKGYMWFADIPKGRGVPEEFKDIVEEVVNLLLQWDVLIAKTSQGKKKYAANPEDRAKIHNILRDRKFSGHLQVLLWGDGRTVSARHLDRIEEPEGR